MANSLVRSTAPFFGDRDPLNGLMATFLRGWPRMASDLDDTSFTRGWVPAVDIRETEQAFELTAELAGMQKEDIEISLDNGVLTLRGTRSIDDTIKKESFRRIERAYGTFERSFSLPAEVDATKASASFDAGLLTLSLPKAETAKARTIKVK